MRMVIGSRSETCSRATASGSIVMGSPLKAASKPIARANGMSRNSMAGMTSPRRDCTSIGIRGNQLDQPGRSHIRRSGLFVLFVLRGFRFVGMVFLVGCGRGLGCIGLGCLGFGRVGLGSFLIRLLVLRRLGFRSIRTGLGFCFDGIFRGGVCIRFVIGI